MRISDRKKSSKQKNIVLIAIVAAVLIGAASIAYVYKFDRTSEKAGQQGDAIDYSPATDEDKQLNDSIKEDLPPASETDDNQVPNSDAPQDDQAEKQSVKPVISAYGQPNGNGTELRVNGFVPGVIESTGTCTLTVQKGEDQATVTKGALRNASDTSCGQLVIPFSELSPGKWEATLSYSSPQSAGKSNITTIEIK